MGIIILNASRVRDLSVAAFADTPFCFFLSFTFLVPPTDIADKDLKQLRNARWERAFSEQTTPCQQEEAACDVVNRKATIVIEHLIQASDVAHTMQHWHVYRKWNERLFMEMVAAYKAGRSKKHPAEFWYQVSACKHDDMSISRMWQNDLLLLVVLTHSILSCLCLLITFQGEIGFFDFYIIPLAKKLKDCGVFGVSSDEYLNYAVQNRQEWEGRGREVVNEMMAKLGP